MRIRKLMPWMMGWALLAVAVPMPALADLKVGFVDQERALLASKEGQEAEKALSALREQKRQTLEPQQQDLQRLGAELESQKFVLSKDVLEERQIELAKRRRDLEREIQAAQEELQIEQRKMLGPLLQQLGEAIQAVSQDRDLDLVLDPSNPGVLYFDDALDVTDLVIKKLNEQSS